MIIEDQAKAVQLAKQAVRRWREAEFAKNDIALQNAMADDDAEAKQAAIARRNYLRSLTEQCEGKTVAELKTFLAELK